MAGSHRHKRRVPPQPWYRNVRVQASVSGALVAGLLTLGAALVSRQTPSRPETDALKSRSGEISLDPAWFDRRSDGGSSVFSSGSVFPKGFEAFGPGTRVSVLSSVYPHPQGKLSLTHFEVSLPDGPFERVWYYHDGEEDPVVTSIAFRFRSKFAKTLVWKNAIANFKAFPYTSKVLGKVIVWPNVNGYGIVLDDESYQIHNAI